ncbi:hypothetical protein L3X38_042974 [Prunus dulcis]|uniref:Uncharacterized protein n=1 Tax=Prunus dulcis TaxID=3755 RepID=A0AAD4UWX5_PRUDU|nr:hypothetical protein L3X38_042974 [Prunus dulcis]
MRAGPQAGLAFGLARVGGSYTTPGLGCTVEQLFFFSCPRLGLGSLAGAALKRSEEVPVALEMLVKMLRILSHGRS